MYLYIRFFSDTNIHLILIWIHSDIHWYFFDIRIFVCIIFLPHQRECPPGPSSPRCIFPLFWIHLFSSRECSVPAGHNLERGMKCIGFKEVHSWVFILPSPAQQPPLRGCNSSLCKNKPRAWNRNYFHPILLSAWRQCSIWYIIYVYI